MRPISELHVGQRVILTRTRDGIAHEWDATFSGMTVTGWTVMTTAGPVSGEWRSTADWISHPGTMQAYSPVSSEVLQVVIPELE